MQKRSRCLARHLVPLTVSASFLLACDDPTTQPTKPQEASDATTVSFLEESEPDTTWDFYSADVQVTLEERPGFGYDGPPDYRHIGYHVERTRGSDNMWSSVVQYANYTPLGVPVAPNLTYDLARVEAHDAGYYSRLYDRSGVLVSSPSPAPTQAGFSPADTLDRDWPANGPPPPSDDPPNDPPDDPQQVEPLSMSRVSMSSVRGPSLVRGIAGKAGAKVSREQGNAWLDEIVLTPARRAKRLEKLERRLGAPEGTERGLRRHVKRDRGMVREVLVDTAVGAVLELNVVRDGKLLHRTLYGYSALGQGTLVRTRTRIERPQPGRPDQPLVIEHVLSNVRVERRGAQ